MECINPDNEFGFFRSWSDVCRSCKGFDACKHAAALSFINDCIISYDPQKVICQECAHKKLCGFRYIHFKGKRLIASPKNNGGNKKKFISEGIRVLPLLVEGNTKDTEENQGGI